MWEDNIESEEYERLMYDYDYAEYSSGANTEKNSSHKSSNRDDYSNSYEDINSSDV